MPRIEQNVVKVELEGHGEFATSIDVIRELEVETKADLITGILRAYESPVEDRRNDPKYWDSYPKAIIEIVHGGIYFPRN